MREQFHPTFESDNRVLSGIATKLQQFFGNPPLDFQVKLDPVSNNEDIALLSEEDSFHILLPQAVFDHGSFVLLNIIYDMYRAELEKRGLWHDEKGFKNPAAFCELFMPIIGTQSGAWKLRDLIRPLRASK